MSATITLTLPDDLKAAVDAEAKAEGVTRAQILEGLVRRHVQERATAAAAAPFTPALPWGEFFRRMAEGVEAPALSDWAVSRASIYEDDEAQNATKDRP